jgi:ParB/RepB/Spo0J family partition protein
MTAVDLADELLVDGYHVLPRAQLRESVDNPRQHFDMAALQELADNIGKVGLLTPLLVRPIGAAKGKPAHYEIAAGHRRFRASKLAGLDELPVIVRDMDDATFLEVLTIDNLQRDDLHPLEEANGFASLMKGAGYDVARIAERVGRSVKYVYDRMKLLQLVPDAKRLFLHDRFTAGHAILLARLSPEDQERAIDLKSVGQVGSVEGIWAPESPLFAGETERGTEDSVKPVSVREFEGWIDRNVRFRPEVVDLPNLFPETAAVLASAAEEEAKVVHITYTHQLHPDVRDESQKTYGPLSWKRADGEPAYDRSKGKTLASKRCDHSVIGVIVVGEGRGQAFPVCVAKQKCAVHWPKPKKATGSAGSGGDDAGFAARERARQEEYERQHREREEKKKRWMKAAPAIEAAVAEKIKKMPAKAVGVLADIITESLGRVKNSAVPRGKSAEDLVRYLAFQQITSDINDTWNAPQDFPKRAKALFGLDVKKILDKVAPVEKVAAAPAAAKNARKLPTVAEAEDLEDEDPDA